MSMAEKPAYYDNRSEFWKSHWQRAVGYEDFLVCAKPEEAARWGEAYARTPDLTPEDQARVKGYNREVNILLYAGAWCPDCARTGPNLQRLAEAAGEKVKLRVIDRDASRELKEELRILGATRVPVAIFLTEDFWEIVRVGDRTLSVYRSKMAREIGRGVDQGILSPEARRRELDEWLDTLERVLIMARLAPVLRKRHGD